MSDETKPTYHVDSFYEEVWDVASGQMLGTRTASDDPNRRKGFYGEREETVTCSFELKVGHKFKLFHASVRYPRTIRTRLFPVCGRRINE